jgi:hypothetical protein
MDELASRSTFPRIMNVTIERRHKYLTVNGIHGGIPHGGACPLAEDAHGGGQYLWPEGGGGVMELWSEWLAGGGGGQYPPEGGGGQLYAGGGGGGGHVEGFPVSIPIASRVLDPYENPVT